MGAAHVYVRAWAPGCFHNPISFDQYPYLSEGAGRVGGQLRGDKECPFSGRNPIWQSLEEGAGKRCSECDTDAVSALQKLVLIRLWKQHTYRVQELWESRGGRPGLSGLMSLKPVLNWANVSSRS